MRLALDIGLAGLVLGIERVEFEVEIVLGRFAGVDRAALGFWDDRLHCPSSPSPSKGCAGVEFPLGRLDLPCKSGEPSPMKDRGGGHEREQTKAFH
jgi:hypothetical protein